MLETIIIIALAVTTGLLARASEENYRYLVVFFLVFFGIFIGTQIATTHTETPTPLTTENYE